MNSRLRIPKGASPFRQKAFKIRLDEPTELGDSTRDLTIRLYVGFASHGYRTDYTRVPSCWLEIVYFDQPSGKRTRKAWSYSGKRYDKALAHWQSIVDDLEAAPDQVEVVAA